MGFRRPRGDRRDGRASGGAALADASAPELAWLRTLLGEAELLALEQLRLADGQARQTAALHRVLAALAIARGGLTPPDLTRPWVPLHLIHDRDQDLLGDDADGLLDKLLESRDAWAEAWKRARTAPGTVAAGLAGSDGARTRVIFGAGTFFWLVGHPGILGALFATIAVQLEDGRWGSRFPHLMDALYSGTLPPDELGPALDELDRIRAELAERPPSEFVWDAEDRSLRPPWGPAAALQLPALSEVFVTVDGARLLDVLGEALDHAAIEELPVRIAVLPSGA